MDIVEGFLYLFIIFEIIGGLVGFGILAIVHTILRWTRNRWINLAILGVGLVLAGVSLLPVDTFGIFLISLFISLPLAVLVPFHLPPIRGEPIVSFDDVIVPYVLVWIVGAVLPWVLVGSHISTIPFISWQYPLSNAPIYALAILVYIVLSAAFYRLLKVLSPSADQQASRQEK